MAEIIKNNQTPADVKLSSLITRGAAEIDDSFLVAHPSQHEVILDERRLLITPNNESYRDYLATLEDSNLISLRPDQSLSDGEVVVGEIPRSSRSLGQVLLSGMNEGATPSDVFRLAGKSFGILAEESDLVPDPESFDPGRVLLIRDEMKIMVIPPVEFIPANLDSREQLAEAMEKHLEPRYENFDGLALLESFKRGLELK